MTEISPEQHERTRAALGIQACPGCGTEIGDALLACQRCFDRLPSQVRNPLFAIGTPPEQQAAVRETARSWLRNNPEE